MPEEKLKSTEQLHCLSALKNKELALDILIQNAHNIDGVKLSGIEKLCATSILGRTDNAISNIVKKYGLYVTAGSDYHGDILHHDRTVGDVFVDEVYTFSKEHFGKTPNGDDFIFVTQLAYLDHFDKKVDIKDEYLIETTNNQVVDDETLEIINAKALKLFHKNSKVRKEKKKQESEERAEKTQIKIRIDHLLKIIDKTNEIIINGNSNVNTKAGLLLKVNKFSESVCEGIEKLVKEGKLGKEDIEQIKELTNKIRTNLKRIAKKQQKVLSGYMKSIENDKSNKEDFLNKLINIDLENNRV